MCNQAQQQLQGLYQPFYTYGASTPSISVYSYDNGKTYTVTVRCTNTSKDGITTSKTGTKTVNSFTDAGDFIKQVMDI